MSIPHRGVTTPSTYFVTANVLGKRSLFQVEKIARNFLEVLFSYRTQGKYLLHEFVVMPDHFHLILTPEGITLERAMQHIKGGFSFRFNKNLKTKRDPWQPSFHDRRVRDAIEYQRHRDYIHQNPVKKGLAKTPEAFPFSSANPLFDLDPVPQRLKPQAIAALPQAVNACSTQGGKLVQIREPLHTVCRIVGRGFWLLIEMADSDVLGNAAVRSA